MNIIKQLAKKVLNYYPSMATKKEYQQQKFTRFNERPVEFGFVFNKMSEYYPKKILDVGTGTTALPHLMQNCGAEVTAIDNIKDYWPDGMVNRHFHIIDQDITNHTIAEKFNMVTCISVLEHIERFDDAVKNMMNLLQPGGILIITCPYSENGYVKNVYDLPGSSYGKGNAFITQSYCRENINKWLSFRQSAIVEQQFWQFWDGEHWTVGNQVIPPVKATATQKHQITCLAIQVK